MKKLNLKDVLLYVEQNIGNFHQKRIQSLDELKLANVLKRKNPYLFKAKYVLTAEQIIKGLVDAHISSNEETIFGDWLEGLAIFINDKVYGGRKSGITGIDLEFDSNDTRNIVTIKSGPNWGNSSQIAKMVADFKTAKKTLRSSNSKLNIIAVNGCCYGRDSKPDKGDYFKYCGLYWCGGGDGTGRVGGFFSMGLEFGIPVVAGRLFDHSGTRWQRAGATAVFRGGGPTPNRHHRGGAGIRWPVGILGRVFRHSLGHRGAIHFESVAATDASDNGIVVLDV